MSQAPLPSNARVGFVGLGNMGRPMAARLVAAGFQLHLCDARPEAAAALAAETGATVVRSTADIGADLDALILMLPDGAAVRQVLVTDDVAARLAPGALVIDMGSCEPHGTAALGADLQARGIDMVDAPVSGGVARALSGTLTIMAGGTAQAVERSQPLLRAMGNRVYVTGRLGSGQAMKSLNNFVSAAGLVATCEAVLIAQRFGLDPQVAAEVLDGSTGKNNTTEHKLRQHILSRTFGSGFSLDLMVKDLGIAASVARQAGMPTVFVERCLEAWQSAQQSLGHGRDHTEMARWVESVMNCHITTPP